MPTMPDNTFIQDFRIAECFGIRAIHDTYDRSKESFDCSPEWMAALTVAINRLLWYHWEKGNEPLARIYDSLWNACRGWCYDHFKGDDFSIYWQLTD